MKFSLVLMLPTVLLIGCDQDLDEGSSAHVI